MPIEYCDYTKLLLLLLLLRFTTWERWLYSKLHDTATTYVAKQGVGTHKLFTKRCIVSPSKSLPYGYKKNMKDAVHQE